VASRLEFKSGGANGGAVMISVMSGKGGVGKSIIAFNLAERLASLGRQVLLVDADNGAGNIHILANLSCEAGLKELVAGNKRLSEVARPFSTCLDILMMSPQGPIDNGLIPADASRLVSTLRTQGNRYDFIVVDHASGVSDAAVVLAAGSDVNILTVIPELTSIADAYGLCKHLHTHYRTADCRLLINRTESEAEGEYVRSRFSAVCEQFLGLIPGFAGVLPEDPVVRRSLARQQPAVTVNPEAPVVQALMAIAESLSQEFAPSVSSHSSETINYNPASADIRG
jgi:flagellar biosynthesis protein FlhG